MSIAFPVKYRNNNGDFYAVCFDDSSQYNLDMFCLSWGFENRQAAKNFINKHNIPVRVRTSLQWWIVGADVREWMLTQEIQSGSRKGLRQKTEQSEEFATGVAVSENRPRKAKKRRNDQDAGGNAGRKRLGT